MKNETPLDIYSLPCPRCKQPETKHFVIPKDISLIQPCEFLFSCPACGLIVPFLNFQHGVKIWLAGMEQIIWWSQLLLDPGDVFDPELPGFIFEKEK